MEIEIQRNPHIDEQFIVQEAASAGLQGMDHFTRLLNHHHQQNHQNQISNQYSLNHQLDCSEITDFTVSKFQKVISVLNRTGHARFRRAPVSSSTSDTNPSPVETMPVPMKSPAKSLTIDFSKPNSMNANVKSKTSSNNEVVSVSAKVSKKQQPCVSLTASSSFMSSITGDFGGEGSVSNGKIGTFSFGIAPAAEAAVVVPVVSSGRPPLGLSNKKRCHDHEQPGNVSGGGGNNCHCLKRRKSRVKNTVRVPAISSKVADIPSDECSWRKYGQKPIKGSPYPRGYYRCSTMRGCPAKKHVERDPNDPTMLIVTYEDVHCHSQSARHRNIATDAGCLDV